MIEETIRELVQARAQLEADKEYKRTLLEAFEQSEEYQIAQDDLRSNDMPKGKAVSKTSHSYTVKFLIRYIVSVDVEADTAQEAIEKAKKIDILPDAEIVDGKTELVGYDDNDLWSEV